jgi:hypothetical protein
MKKLLIPILALLLFAGCGDDNVRPGSKKLRVYEQSAVQETYPYVTSGDALVFHFYKSEPDDPNIADEEFSEDFLMEINTQENSFTYSSRTLAIYDMPVIYRQYCFCGGFNNVVMTQFEFSGSRKSNGDWQLSGDLTLTLQYVDEETDEVLNEWEREIKLDGRFVKSSRPQN